MPMRDTEIFIQFRDVPYSIFASRGATTKPNKLIIGLQPEESIEPAAVAASLADDVRARSADVSDRILKAKTVTGKDSALREEIASIAAKVVALTALKEGETSPIRKLLPETAETGAQERLNLAGRAAAILTEDK